MPLEAGFSVVALDPPLGGSMPGYFADRKATGTIDPIQAKCLVLRDSAQPAEAVAVVSLDLIALARAECEAIRKAVAAGGKVRPERVWLHATHTHTGPMAPRRFASDAEAIFPGLYPGVVDPDFIQRLVARTADAVAKAAAAAKPTSMKVGHAQVAGAAMYRRSKLADGSVLTNAPRNDARVVGPAGEVDPNVSVIAFPEASTSLVIYGLHPDIIGGTLYSADYPATVADAFKAGSGHDVVFLNAACGNINHIDRSRDDQMKGIDESRRIGRAIAEKALEALKSANSVESTPVRVAHRDVPSRLRIVPEADVKEALRLEKEEPKKARAFNGLFAPAAIVLGRTKDREHLARIMAMRIGPVGLVGMPGEIFVELAREVQHEAPLDIVRTIGLSNGGMGYIPTAQAFEDGGYETGYRSARYRPETGHDWAKAGVELLRGLV
jgi:hypothetical protein